MLAKHGIGVQFSVDAPVLEKGKNLITGQRFNTDENGGKAAQDYAQMLVLSEDTDVFLMLIPKIDIDVSEGFTLDDAEYYVTTCVDPRIIGVVLGVFSSGQTEDGYWGFTYQDLQEGHNHEHDH